MSSRLSSSLRATLSWPFAARANNMAADTTPSQRVGRDVMGESSRYDLGKWCESNDKSAARGMQAPSCDERLCSLADVGRECGFRIRGAADKIAGRWFYCLPAGGRPI